MRSRNVVECSFGPSYAWNQALVSRGFEWSAGHWRRGEMGAYLGADWVSLESSAPAAKEALRVEDLAGPGLWKRITHADCCQSVFELPAALASEDEESYAENGLATPEALLDWALASAQGIVNPIWRPPSRDWIASWLPAKALTVRAGCLVRQGEVVTDNAWVLRFPLLPAVSRELPTPRRRALDCLASDAQSRCRMIRVDWIKQDVAQALIASVDLTGAPHSNKLFLAGLQGLSHAVAWLAETANLLADVTLTLRSPEMLPHTNQARKESA